MNKTNFCLVTILICVSAGVPLKDRSLRKHPKGDRRNYLPTKHSTCIRTLSVCNDTAEYPTDVIQKLVKKRRNVTLFSNVSLIEPAEGVPRPRLRNEPEPNNLCRTQTVTMVPTAGYDYRSNQHRYIVNIRDYAQLVVYEACVNPNKECDKFSAMPFGFRTQCTQKYNVMRLVSLTKKGKLEFGKFMVPSTCVCSYLKEMF